MDIEDLKRIVGLMEGSKLTELDLESGDFKLRLRRSPEEVRSAGGASIVNLPPPFLRSEEVGPACPLPVKPVEEKGIHYIKSPTVGTFYAFPNPDSQPFVKQGDIVKSDTVVCIIEAMKVMNEVHAECGGEILEVLARNGCPVEYGQALFKVKLDTV